MLEEVVALIVHQDECREVLHLNLPDSFHTEFGIFHTLNALDIVLRQNSCRATDRTEIETAVLLASVCDLLAAVTFGKYTPYGTLGGVLVFGLGEALSYRLQVSGGAFPYEFALMLPYILTVLALCIFSRNAKDPAALGIPYVKSH